MKSLLVLLTGLVIFGLFVGRIISVHHRRTTFVPQSWDLNQIPLGTSSEHDPFACGYPAFTKVEKGLAEEEVKQILGEPYQVIVKERLGDYQFAQGTLESSIKSGWLYLLPEGWTGQLEIYFSSTGKVVGKNCGQG